MRKPGRKDRALARPAGLPTDSGGSSGNARSVVTALIPVAAYAALFVATLHEWYIPFADSSREVAVPLRLLGGDLLYRDVVYQYGPLSPYLDALALKLFGETLSSLVAVRVLVSVVGIEVLRRLVGTVVRSAFLASCITTAVVTATFFLPNGGDWPFPYSVAALEGTVGTWLALLLVLGSNGWRRSIAGGVVAGLAACTKPEFAFLAPIAIAFPLLIRRPRREAAGALALSVVLPLMAWGIPPAVLGVDVVRERGFLIYLDTPDAWRRLYRGLFWGGGSIGTLFSARTVATFGISAGFLGLGALAVRLGEKLGRIGLVLSFVVGASAVAIPANREIQLLVPLSSAVLLAGGLRLLRTWKSRPKEPVTRSLAYLGPVALVPAFRQPFSVAIGAPYSAFTAPAALAVSLSLLAVRAGAPAHVGSFLLGLSAAQATDRVREHREGRRELLRFERGTVSLYDCEAKVVGGLVEWLDSSTPPGATVAGLPYPGFVLFLADRRSAFVDDAMDAGSLGHEAEKRAATAIAEKELAAGFFVNRPFLEFGFGFFGEGFGEDVVRALQKRMAPAGEIGGPSPGCPATALVDRAVLFVPRGEGPPVDPGRRRTP